MHKKRETKVIFQTKTSTIKVAAALLIARYRHTNFVRPEAQNNGRSRQRHARKRMKKTGHLMTSFAERFCRGFAEELKNDNPQRT